MRLDEELSEDFDRNPAILRMRTRAELVGYIHDVFEREGSAPALGVESATLRRLIGRVGRRYHENPYHNFHHAADTVNTMAWMVTRPMLQRALPREHRFALMLAALVHDVEHPGTNNAWEVQMGSELARRYDNTAVLEHYSLDVTLALLEEPQYNVLAGFEPDCTRELKRLLRELVLATDFAWHRDFLDQYNRLIEQKGLDLEDSEVREWVCRALIKGADIANTTKPYSQAALWGRRVMLEFWAQGVFEKQYNFPVGPFNDPDTVKLNATQAGFIRFAAMELFELLAAVEPDMHELVDNLADNLERYERKAREE